METFIGNRDERSFFITNTDAIQYDEVGKR
jgi:hypothetical protein